MLLYQATHTLYTNYYEAAHNKKVIILYPHTNYRNLFLCYMLQDKEKVLVFHSVPEHVDNLTNWFTALIDEFEQVYPQFGDQSRGLITEGQRDTHQLAQALIADLNAMINRPTMLYFDELDRLEPTTEFRSFFSTLVENLPDKLQLVVSSRMLTYQPWASLVAQDIAAVLGTAHRRNDLIYTRTERFLPQVEIQGFGQGIVWMNGQRVGYWDGQLPRYLFHFFIDHHLVTRDQIFQEFWPRLTKREATNVFHVTKRKINEILNKYVPDKDEYELTRYGGGFYRPSYDIARHYDVFEFEDLLDSAAITASIQEQDRLYTRALQLYRAPFLQDADMPWIVKRRDILQERFLDATYSLAEIAGNQKDYQRAIGLLVRAVRMAPEREDLTVALMRCYHADGQPHEALNQYEVYVRFLKVMLQLDPPTAVTRLRDTISADMP